MYHHLHIGPGALGLGQVVPAFRANGTKVTVLSRRSLAAKIKVEILKSKRSYHIVEPKQKSAVDIDYCYYLDELPLDQYKGHTCLITVSVKTGVHDDALLSAIYRIIEHGILNFEQTLVVACENTITTRELKLALQRIRVDPEDSVLESRVVHFLEAVCDRVCSKPECADDLIVHVGNKQALHVEWVEWLEPFKTSVTTASTFADIRAEKIKKSLILNLSHVLISIWALKDGYTALDSYLNDSKYGDEHLHHILGELVSILTSVYDGFDESDLVHYASDVKIRFKTTPDSPSRILKRFSSEQNISEFYQDIWKKGLSYFLQIAPEDMAQFPYISSSLLYITEMIVLGSYVSLG